MSMLRSFLSLPLDEPTRDALGAMADECPLGRPTAPENLHLTLHFLGDQQADALQTLHETLEVQPLPRPDLRFDGLMGFGQPPKLLAASVAPNPALTALHKSLRGALHSAGIMPETRRFRPHVTLLRLPRRLPPHANAQLQAFTARHMSTPIPPSQPDRAELVHSTLTPDGPLYEVLAEYPLG